MIPPLRFLNRTRYARARPRSLNVAGEKRDENDEHENEDDNETGEDVIPPLSILKPCSIVLVLVLDL